MLFILALLILSIAIVFYYVPDKTVSYIGLSVSLILLIALVFFGLRYFFRQEIRPADGNPSSLSILTPEGMKLELQNPPDKAFNHEQVQGTLRAMLVSFDPNLASDGEVIGDASKQEYRWYKEKEKKEFQDKHKKDIFSKKKEIKKLMHETEDQENDNGPVSVDCSATVEPPPES